MLLSLMVTHAVYKTDSLFPCSILFLMLQDCDYCNCSRYLSDKYGNSTIPTVPSTTTGTTVLTTTQPYDIVNNPENSDVSEPVDTRKPIAQRACGIQVFSGMILLSVESLLRYH